MRIEKILSFLRSVVMPFSPPMQIVDNKNEALSELSYMFFTDTDEPTFGVNHLDVDKLDFSLESLKCIDEYLEKIRTEKEVVHDWNRIVLRAGAYVGEVIRRNDKKTVWLWVDWEAAKNLNAKLFALEYPAIGVMALLYNPESGFVFPLGKVEKYLANGSEDSVLFFAQVIMKYKPR